MRPRRHVWVQKVRRNPTSASRPTGRLLADRGRYGVPHLLTLSVAVECLRRSNAFANPLCGTQLHCVSFQRYEAINDDERCCRGCRRVRLSHLKVWPAHQYLIATLDEVERELALAALAAA